MKVYTRGGDLGLTSLFGGARVRKDAARIEAYGTVDELMAAIGCAHARLEDAGDEGLREVLQRVQSELFDLASELATPQRAQREARGDALPRVEGGEVDQLERWIDGFEEELPELRHFILPGGAPAAALLHLARTVCRRAERAVVRLGQAEEVSEVALRYLNRLSDLLFVMARVVNARRDIAEPKWIGRERRTG